MSLISWPRLIWRHAPARLTAVSRRRHFRRASRGNAGLLAAVTFPVLILFGSLAVDQSYFYFRALLTRQTVQAAALAAAGKLTTYYAQGDQSTTAILSAAQQFSQLNMPAARYGTVVPASDVILGNWDSTSSTFTSLAASGGASPNAVQVTGYSTAAHGNPIRLFFGGVYGRPTVDVTSTVVSSFGTGQPFNTIIINDLSGSFAPSIGDQQLADSAILDCVATNTGSMSQLGITGFDGHSTIVQPLVRASTNTAAIQSVINGLNSCGNAGAPACTGSNIAAGLYSAIQQFSAPAFASQSKNVIIITDGVPNVSDAAYPYGAADGLYPAPSSTPVCPGVNPGDCADADLWAMAQNQAANARAAAINVSTIYYSGDTVPGQQASYAAALATLVSGTGVAMVAPSQSQIGATYAGFCATMTTALKSVR